MTAFCLASSWRAARPASTWSLSPSTLEDNQDNQLSEEEEEEEEEEEVEEEEEEMEEEEDDVLRLHVVVVDATVVAADVKDGDENDIDVDDDGAACDNEAADDVEGMDEGIDDVPASVSIWLTMRVTASSCLRDRHTSIFPAVCTDTVSINPPGTEGKLASS